MASRLIKLEDGTFIEVEIASSDVREISGSTAKQVESTFSIIKPTLVRVCRSVAGTWNDWSEGGVEISQAEVEIGLSFSIEGTVYLAKSKADANLKVKMILKAKEVLEEEE